MPVLIQLTLGCFFNSIASNFVSIVGKWQYNLVLASFLHAFFYFSSFHEICSP